MSFECALGDRAYNVGPVDFDVDSDYVNIRKVRIVTMSAPWASGGKLGLSKALKSEDETLDTLFPRYRV